MVTVAVVPSGKVTVTVLPGSDVPLTSTEPSELVTAMIVGVSGAVVSVYGVVVVGLGLPAASVAPATTLPLGWSIGEVTGP